MKLFCCKTSGMKRINIVLVFFLIHFIPTLFFLPLLFAFKTPVTPASVVTSIYGLYKWLKAPEIVEGTSYVAYGPPATFWVAEGTKRVELRVPDSVPLQDSVSNFFMRRKLRRAAEKPIKSWISPGYGLLSLTGLGLYALVFSCIFLSM